MLHSRSLILLPTVRNWVLLILISVDKWFPGLENPSYRIAENTASKMSSPGSNCPHLESVGEITKEELIQKSHVSCSSLLSSYHS